MDSLGNVNHAISVVGNCIFDSNYEKALVLNRASLDMICAPSVGEEQDAIFETVFTAVRYIYNGGQLKKRIVLIYQYKHNHNHLCCYIKE